MMPQNLFISRWSKLRCSTAKNEIMSVSSQFAKTSCQWNIFNFQVFVVVVQSPSCVWLFATPSTATCQVSLSFTISQSFPKFMSIALVMLTNHVILWSPLLLPLNFSQYQGLLQWVTCSYQMTKILEFQLQHQSFQWVFRIDSPQDWLLWYPCNPRGSQESSLAP